MGRTQTASECQKKYFQTKNGKESRAKEYAKRKTLSVKHLRSLQQKTRRLKLKQENPEAYQKILKKARERAKARYAKKKEKMITDQELEKEKLNL